MSWRPARRFLTKVFRDLSAVGSPHRTLALPEVFSPGEVGRVRPSPDPLPGLPMAAPPSYGAVHRN